MSKGERSEYMKKYRKLKKRPEIGTDLTRYVLGSKTLKKRTDIGSYVEGHIVKVDSVIYTNPEPVTERTLRIKVQRCQWNRCNKILTMTEKLYGNNCQRHSIGQTPNIYHQEQLYK